MLSLCSKQGDSGLAIRVNPAASDAGRLRQEFAAPSDQATLFPVGQHDPAAHVVDSVEGLLAAVQPGRFGGCASAEAHFRPPPAGVKAPLAEPWLSSATRRAPPLLVRSSELPCALPLNHSETELPSQT